MELPQIKKVLISGASMAGLSTAYLMNSLGYEVTIVEIASHPRTDGAAVDIKGVAVEVAKRMGIYAELKRNRLQVEKVEFKNADDLTEGSLLLDGIAELADGEIEIERDKFVSIVRNALKDNVAFIFKDSITALNETDKNIEVSFKNGPQRTFDFVFGCDGMHSGVRKLWFGHESEYAHFLGAYFSLTIAYRLLIPQKTMQAFNVPGKGIMLNAYNNKTDIIFCLLSDKEIPYDYRDTAQQRRIIDDAFSGLGWRTPELLQELQQSGNFYFDKFCQIKMPSWTKGRVALVGDAGYCASPAAGMGASLSMIGAASLADALKKYDSNHQLAFDDYNRNLRPFIEKIQAIAERNVKENFIPRTEEDIRKRNAMTQPF